MPVINNSPFVYHADRALLTDIPEHLTGKKVHATWITYKERSIWCCDFSGYGKNPQGLSTEIEISDMVIRRQAQNSLLMTLVLYKTPISPEIAFFLKKLTLCTPSPIHKMAVLFLSDFNKAWYRFVLHGKWPCHTAFLNDYEQAKAWLVKDAP
ncbi:MAG: hypothetical protein LWX83_19260 [Anaerolineae bacterium]|nr:hypothetical protein [Anaerolineae bacterium]